MSDFKLNPEDVAREAIRRGVAKFWSERIRDMADHGHIVTGHLYGDRTTSPYVRVARVPKSWPDGGLPIILERADGATVKLFMKGAATWGEFEVEVKPATVT